MGFSSIVAALMLVSCVCQTEAFSVSEMEDEFYQEFDATKSVKRYRVHISEKGTKFDEKIYIDEKNDIEYIKTPPHNGNIASDNLYDFKMNITVSRVKKDRVCHISPLPEDLPRPGVLADGLREIYNKPASHNITEVALQWRLGPEVDKTTLRREVQDFCGSFKIHRVEPFSLDSVSKGKNDITEPEQFMKTKGRVKRSFDYPLCDKGKLPGQCNPNNWLWSCTIRDTKCVYYLTCNPNVQRKRLTCNSLANPSITTEHRYTSFVCCNPKCP